MKLRSVLFVSCVSLIALGWVASGSVVAFAQAVPPETAADVPSAAQVSEGSAPSSTDVAQQGQAQNEPDAGPVEDAPVDVPTSPQADWAPDINLDAQAAANTAPSTAVRSARPRKILSDAGENVAGTGGWSSATNSAAAQAQILARANRRERAIDPLKRSELTRLSRVMGALHALRVSCSGRDDQTYRSRMATMLDLEAPGNGDLRDPLVDAFNGGFQAYGRGASACPTDARVQEASLAKDGYQMARTLGARYRPAPKVVAKLPPATQPRQNPSTTPAEAKAIVPAKLPQQAAPAQNSGAARPSWTNTTQN